MIGYFEIGKRKIAVLLIKTHSTIYEIKGILKKPHLVLVLLLSFTLISTASCKQGASSDYPVLESGYNAFKKTHWIDNDRVIFSGYPSGLPKNNDQRGIYIWNTKTGKVEFLAKAEGGLCFDSDNNYVHYALGRELLEQADDGVTERIGWGYGPLDAVKEEWNTVFTPRGVDQKEDRSKSLFNKFTCKIVERPPELIDHSWRPLKPKHGYLDYGLKNTKERRKQPPVLYYLRADGERIALPVNNEAVWVIAYYPFKKAYFFRPSFSFNGRDIQDKTKAKCAAKGYWVFPDGQAEKVCVPHKEEWKAGSVLVYPVKPGLLLLSNRGGKYAGGYLIKGIQAEKTISGFLGAVSVSPDGCKVAFANRYASPDGKSSGSKLQMINLCK